MKLEPFHDDLQSNLNSFNNPKFKAPMMFRCFDSQFVEAFRTIEPNKSSRLATRKEKAKLGDEDSGDAPLGQAAYRYPTDLPLSICLSHPPQPIISKRVQKKKNNAHWSVGNSWQRPNGRNSPIVQSW